MDAVFQAVTIQDWDARIGCCSTRGHIRRSQRKVADELRLPFDAPRTLADGTMKRFVDWHKRLVN
jgi:hypothetical protein